MPQGLDPLLLAEAIEQEFARRWMDAGFGPAPTAGKEYRDVLCQALAHAIVDHFRDHALVRTKSVGNTQVGTIHSQGTIE